MFGHFPFSGLPFSDFLDVEGGGSPPGNGGGPGEPSGDGNLLIFMLQAGMI